MRRTTFIVGLIVAVLVIGYGGWLSHVASTKPANGSDTSQTDRTDTNDHEGGKPGEAPKD